VPDADVSAFHVAVDAHDLVRDERGIGRYVRAVLARWMKRSDLRVSLIVRDPLPFRFAPAFAKALGVAEVAVSSRVPRDADVTWHPWNGTFTATDGPAAATIHDVVPFAFPELDERKRESQQTPFRRTANRASAIACDSTFTAHEVERYLEIPANRLTVVPLAADDCFSLGNDDDLPAVLTGRPYVLYVGTHDEHKNSGTLAAAHRLAFPDDDVALVFTRPNPVIPEAIAIAHAAEAQLVALYRAATIVAVPSLYEGFGLPVLEAMACGAPVLASRAASLPEVGGDAARYVDDPESVHAWRTALGTLAGDAAARADLARRGPVRAAQFSWDRCADATLDVVKSARA
jgi:glycosyltransferase involved in cell wall biosynthesis